MEIARRAGRPHQHEGLHSDMRNLWKYPDDCTDSTDWGCDFKVVVSHVTYRVDAAYAAACHSMALNRQLPFEGSQAVTRPAGRSRPWRAVKWKQIGAGEP